ncbi:hypothetical protein MYAER_3110 [Microcystis aeruginosa NIES-2549]|uniref:Uncharacterized protein n=1 Tax=Microcystis aeruginosa NIES-2549 TaxID=1641812 RepID=A0A0F6RMD0_MICAE|nr:hypothetical protein MYAER_3110 [Microcystis aeruginosa NIES-2549]AOC53863.1 hypothetical protein amyaer_3156 [Microcystis aeruginosa NIES-2481]
MQLLVMDLTGNFFPSYWKAVTIKLKLIQEYLFNFINFG